MTDLPNPGTAPAINQGCTCPVIDNCYGRGYRGQAGMFVYTWGCPVHSPAPDETAGSRLLSGVDHIAPLFMNGKPMAGGDK